MINENGDVVENVRSNVHFLFVLPKLATRWRVIFEESSFAPHSNNYWQLWFWCHCYWSMMWILLSLAITIGKSVLVQCGYHRAMLQFGLMQLSERSGKMCGSGQFSLRALCLSAGSRDLWQSMQTVGVRLLMSNLEPTLMANIRVMRNFFELENWTLGCAWCQRLMLT